jgi:hypothetical protein
MSVRNSKSVYGVNLVSAFALAGMLLFTSGLCAQAQEDSSESQGGRLEGLGACRCRSATVRRGRS